MTMEFAIIPPHLAVKAMRDSGYRNAAYAVAELIDNSLQARASTVSLLCFEEVHLVKQRTRRQLAEVAVLDNGDGMTADNTGRLIYGTYHSLRDRC